MKELIGILTGGGDCPGLNAVIRAIVRKGVDAYGYSFVGIKDGWKGLLELDTVKLDKDSIRGTLHLGGTILGSSRTNPGKSPETLELAVKHYRELGLDALIAIGGDDTLGAAARLYEMGLNIVGVPKTIDNDLSGTDLSFGFITAVETATEAIDRLHSTAESHHRAIVVEVMGRHAGWIATYAGIAGGGDVVLIPEEPIDLEYVCKLINQRKALGRQYSIIVVAEGCRFKDESEVATLSGEKDEFGHVRLGGIGNRLAEEIEKRTGIETRATILGHIQRGGTPSAFDRVLSTRYGIAAIDFVHEKRFGKMTALRGDKIVPVDLSEATAETRTVDMELYNIAKVFFG
ncbi:MAG: ATP-dependent 6-phosphofructokinase [Methanobacteriota archaeon]|nr:MAG: ATP-dependent 6-phosphofructokinase [Euryarchaeota archaeon]